MIWKGKKIRPFEFAVFPEDYDITSLFPGLKRFRPSFKEASNFQNLLPNFLKSEFENSRQLGFHNCESLSFMIYNLADYKCQIFGLVNAEGKRIIWGNFLRGYSLGNWKEELKILQKKELPDFFSIKFDAEKAVFFELSINA